MLHIAITVQKNQPIAITVPLNFLSDIPSNVFSTEISTNV